ncbi:hypothetical protein EVAR_55371_1 [Eumeta japonica]|uniref:Uncharacterized protein n=1 Tax=Eumeta variegata TaxID=151549 RepID=A0A4C1YWG9_EUMVA|nr:hypothetical protein EVAR_55371_1 [Eumeta japonica]
MCGDRRDGSDNKTSPLWSRNGRRGRANNKSYAIHHRPPNAAQRCSARAPWRTSRELLNILNPRKSNPCNRHGAARAAAAGGAGRGLRRPQDFIGSFEPLNRP